jgi:hypothetical protein
LRAFVRLGQRQARGVAVAAQLAHLLHGVGQESRAHPRRIAAGQQLPRRALRVDSPVELRRDPAELDPR